MLGCLICLMILSSSEKSFCMPSLCIFLSCVTFAATLFPFSRSLPT